MPSRLDKARRKIRELAFDGLSEVKVVHILGNEIPTVKTPFSNAGDFIRRLELSNDIDATQVEYWAPRGLVFPKEFHEVAEILLVVDGVIEMEVLRPDKTERIILKKGDFIHIKEFEKHRAWILEDLKCLITWSPKFKDNQWTSSTHK